MKGSWVLFLAGLAAAPAPAAEVLPPARQRFAAAKGEEVPSFQRHVIPLLGRLGCNGRACHGSFQGQGGFRLSLFGYDFKADHDALTVGEQPRINRQEPAQSLALRKPSGATKHKGGKLLNVGGWEYHTLLRWIEAGVPPVKDSDADFATLEIEPKEIVFQKTGDTVQLRVIAHWSDGVREDVTPLCRFRSNDDAIAGVDETGLVKAVGKGDTDVVAFYDNGVAPVQVILPVSERNGDRYPQVVAPTKIDKLVLAKLKKLGIVPAELCTDAEFLRRLSLDLTGTLPTAGEVTAFLSDTSPDKRARKIDELLSRPTYAAWWAARLSDWTGNNDRNGPLGGEQALNGVKAAQWYQWLHRRVQDNVPYDKLVEGIALGVSRRPNQNFDDYCAEMSAYFRKDNPVDFATRETMPYYWSRRAVNRPEEKALSFAHTFLGVALQCAQCHKHPYDQWTKQDFDQFTAFFAGIRFGNTGGARLVEMKKEVGLGGMDEDSGTYKRLFVQGLQQGKVMPFKEVTIPAKALVQRATARPNPKLGRVITPKLLGGEEVIAGKYDDPRQPVMDWLRQEDNPYFARAFVNRVWAGYFNVGLIEPTDDQNLANPPSNPALLDHLSHEFIKHGYDMKWLHRTIANSHTYQRSWRPNDTNRLDERNYSRAVLRRLPAEVAYDALRFATIADESQKLLLQDPVGQRAIGLASSQSNSRDGSSYAVNLFGKPAQAINCDCERSAEPTLLQTVYLRNDQELLNLLNHREGWLTQVTKAKERDFDALVTQAYLRTLSRLPDERERERARQYLRDNASGLRDLLWALLNTKEFMVNH